MSQQYIPIILGVGETRTIHTSGRVFACDTSTGDFAVRFDNSGEITGSSKRVFGSSTSPQFSRVTIRNTAAVTNTILYAISNSDIKIEQQVSSIIATITVAAQKNAPTYPKGTTASLAAGATIAFSGLNGSDARKSFSVFNDHATDPLLIRGANGTAGHKILAQQGYPVESGGSLTLHNPGANAITYYVMEVFYS